MPSTITKYNVVVASSSDVAKERDTVQFSIEKLREEFENDGVTFTLKRWEKDVDPTFHDLGGQGRIDECLKISESDIFIGIFYKRVGTPVFDSASGTQHELAQAIESWNEKRTPDIKLYFRKVLTPFDELKEDEIEAIGKIKTFKKGLFEHGIIQDYSTDDEFEELIEKHLRNFLKSKLGKEVNSHKKVPISQNQLSDFEKLTEIYKQEEKLIDFKSSKEQIEKVEDLKRKLYNEIFQSFEEKKENLPNIVAQMPKLVFDKVFTYQKLDGELLNEISELRYNKSQYNWYDRALVVSGVTLNILCKNEFDNKRCHVLIDFILDFEGNVWQRALVGLVLILIKNQNKFQRFSDVVSRLKSIQNNPNVQKAIVFIDIILRERLYLHSLFGKDIFEYDFFKKEVSNCFLPFYDGNPILNNALDNASFDFDSDSFKKFIRVYAS